MENKAVLQTSELLSRGIRKSKLKKGSKEEVLESLIEEARSAIVQLQNIRKYYEFVTDRELVEYAIYREKAEEERISYLLKKIKELANKDII
ncbi:DUF2508 family protein [Clostridium cylindrosporum]|uniref:Uncharacterized protein n=1 Tax=Clostridium cylindrosporum DSM 605 TaxID=1121307 RepID=A0A0J8D9C3_CLOCY|nr:DUF2508 family protein [Clostridium cylindrosporum]KMT22457.1 hypothetical protein CLCY_10c00020 [Clostridium cylindrosporum DSM 605]